MKQSSTKKSSVSTVAISRKHKLVILIGLLVLVGGLFGIFALVGDSIDPNKVDSFSECTRSDGSLLQESYPEMCVTKDGQRFANPAQTAPRP